MIPALEVQLCGRRGGRGDRGACLLEEEEEGGAASVGAAGPGEFPRVVGGGGISSRRGGGRAATLLDARPASAPRTPASLFGALGVRFRWAPSGAEQKTFPFPIPRSLLFFLAALATTELRVPVPGPARGDLRGQERADSVRLMAAAGGPATRGWHRQRRALSPEAASTPVRE